MQDLKARLKFATDHMDKEETLRKTEETKMYLFGCNEQQYDLRWEGEPLKPYLLLIMVLVVLRCGALICCSKKS